MAKAMDAVKLDVKSKNTDIEFGAVLSAFTQVYAEAKANNENLSILTLTKRSMHRAVEISEQNKALTDGTQPKRTADK